MGDEGRPKGRSAPRSRSRQRTRVTIVEAAGGSISADIAFGDDDATADGGPKLETMVAVADDLAGRGAALVLAPGQSILAVETSIRRFARAGPRKASAIARRLYHGPASMVWEVTIAAVGDRADPFARVTQTLAIEGSADAVVRTSPAPVASPDPARQEPEAASSRRELIAAAAAVIIARKGFAGASIREIADAAGLHVPTLYQYVASKDEILELVYAGTMAVLRADVERRIADHSTAESRLRAAIGVLLGQTDGDRPRIGLLNRELKSLTPAARIRVLDDYRALLDALAAIVLAGVEAGEFRAVEPAIVANLATAATDMWALRQFAIGRFGVAAYADEITELILRGLRPS